MNSPKAHILQLLSIHPQLCPLSELQLPPFCPCLPNSSWLWHCLQKFPTPSYQLNITSAHPNGSSHSMCVRRIYQTFSPILFSRFPDHACSELSAHLWSPTPHSLFLPIYISLPNCKILLINVRQTFPFHLSTATSLVSNYTTYYYYTVIVF